MVRIASNNIKQFPGCPQYLEIIGRFNSKDSSRTSNYHSYSLGNESMTVYQRAKSGRRVLITALYFFSSPFPNHSFYFPFFSFPLHLKPLYMTRIRNKNKRQENKNILLTNNKKQEKNETFNERNQNRSIHC